MGSATLGPAGVSLPGPQAPRKGSARVGLDSLLEEGGKACSFKILLKPKCEWPSGTALMRWGPEPPSTQVGSASGQVPDPLAVWSPRVWEIADGFSQAEQGGAWGQRRAKGHHCTETWGCAGAGHCPRGAQTLLPCLPHPTLCALHRGVPGASLCPGWEAQGWGCEVTMCDCQERRKEEGWHGRNCGGRGGGGREVTTSEVSSNQNSLIGRKIDS